MIKFESYLAINNNDNENNTAIVEIRLALSLYSYNDTLLICRKVTKVVCCCIICNLTTKPMPTF